MLVSQCNFLFNHYTDIYNKVKKEEISLKILWELLDVLRRIETSDLDQHSGAYEVGNLLKKLYIDSALKKADKIDKKTGKKTTKPVIKPKKITYTQFKNMQT